MIDNVVISSATRPRSDDADWARHVFRELNKDAHALAARHAFSYTEYDVASQFKFFRMYFDGSSSRKCSGGGWVLFGSNAAENDEVSDWVRIADLSFGLYGQAAVTVADLEACLWGVAYVSATCRGHAAVQEHMRKWRPLDTKRFQVLEIAGFLD